MAENLRALRAVLDTDVPEDADDPDLTELDADAPSDAPALPDPASLSLSDRHLAAQSALAFLTTVMHSDRNRMADRLAAARMLMEFTLGRPGAGAGADKGGGGGWEAVLESVRTKDGSGGGGTPEPSS